MLSERWQARDRRWTREWNYRMGWAILTRRNFMHMCVDGNINGACVWCPDHVFFYVRSTFVALLCASRFTFVVSSYFRSPFDACNNSAWRLSRLQSTPGPFEVRSNAAIAITKRRSSPQSETLPNAKRRRVKYETYKKWVMEFDKDCQTMTWKKEF